MAQVIKSSGLRINFLNLCSNFAHFASLCSVHFKPCFDPLRIRIWEHAMTKVVSMIVSFPMAFKSSQSEIVWKSYDGNSKHCHKLFMNNYPWTPLLLTLHFPLLIHLLPMHTFASNLTLPTLNSSSLFWIRKTISKLNRLKTHMSFHFFEIILFFKDVIGITSKWVYYKLILKLNR